MIEYRVGEDLDLDEARDLYCYLSDLAVRDTHQKRGIGRELIARTRAELGPRSMIVLLAAPAAVNYYPKLGFAQHGSAWILRAGEPLA